MGFAPHRRGSTHSLPLDGWPRYVCPAQAGVYLLRLHPAVEWASLPRTGGGLPITAGCFTPSFPFAPHRRGSTLSFYSGVPAGGVCPAQAGVYRGREMIGSRWRGLPRTGGGLPAITEPWASSTRFAPHRRGSTVYQARYTNLEDVCPAQAGVYPVPCSEHVSPARLPRTGGGLPCSNGLLHQFSPFAPHRRGSTCNQRRGNPAHGVCPAQAGVYPDMPRPVPMR